MGITAAPEIFNIVLIMAGVFLFSVLTIFFIKKYSLIFSLIDVPNERSSHSVPTPRGGGLAISTATILGTVLVGLMGYTPPEISVGLCGGLVIVTITGWLDDHYNLAVLWRLILYFMAAIWTLFWIGPIDSVLVGDTIYYIGITGNIIAVIGIVWLTNLYNFMDGSDGIAGAQAICTSIPAGILFWLSAQYGLAIICYIIMSSALGFLIWNWPPARIFMGDVGSCLIGFCFGTLALLGEKTSSIPVGIWIILLSIFICDASFTLIKRILNREPWFRSHRVHAYQLLLRSGMSHTRLVVHLILVNILFLWPMAWFVKNIEKLSLYFVFLCVIIMLLLWGYIQQKELNINK